MLPPHFHRQCASANNPRHHVTLLSSPPRSIPTTQIAGATDPLSLSGGYNITAPILTQDVVSALLSMLSSHEQREYEDDMERSDDPPDT